LLTTVNAPVHLFYGERQEFQPMLFPFCTCSDDNNTGHGQDFYIGRATRTYLQNSLILKYEKKTKENKANVRLHDTKMFHYEITQNCSGVLATA